MKQVYEVSELELKDITIRTQALRIREFEFLYEDQKDALTKKETELCSVENKLGGAVGVIKTAISGMRGLAMEVESDTPQVSAWKDSIKQLADCTEKHYSGK